jgi:acetyltransferase-like isoleucine patch superfamily enzyme
MPLTTAKQLIEYLKNRAVYPGARIGFGARITGSSRLDEGVTVESGAYVFASKLGANAQVRSDCKVFESELGRNAVIYSNTVLSKTTFGDFSYVNESSLLRGVSVGRFCSIGPHFLCGYGDHPTVFVSTSPAFYSTKMQCGTSFTQRDYFSETSTTAIANDVWIGARVFVRDGVKIGDGAMVGAGAVVVRDIPPYAIVGGVPAKIIRYRFAPELVDELLTLQWWNWKEERLREAQPLIAESDIGKFIAWAKERS